MCATTESPRERDGVISVRLFLLFPWKSRYLWSFIMLDVDHFISIGVDLLRWFVNFDGVLVVLQLKLRFEE